MGSAKSSATIQTVFPASCFIGIAGGKAIAVGEEAAATAALAVLMHFDNAAAFGAPPRLLAPLLAPELHAVTLAIKAAGNAMAVTASHTGLRALCVLARYPIIRPSLSRLRRPLPPDQKQSPSNFRLNSSPPLFR